MLQQYFAAREEYPGVLLAMRVGDFYEFYGPDAETAARELEITLTGREDGENGRIAMAGVPFHSVEKYLARLIAKGHKVALCDQLEDPKSAKGLVKRGVTRVLTPGTVLEDSMLPGQGSNILAAVCAVEGRIGLARLDPTTGEFAVTEFGQGEVTEALLSELIRLKPSELLTPPNGPDSFASLSMVAGSVTERQPQRLERATSKLMDQLHTASLAGFGCSDKPAAITAASMILAYAESVHLPLRHVDHLSTYHVEAFMQIDHATRRSLELTANLIDGGKKLTLFEVLDGTLTPMGGRMLRRWIEQPLLDLAAINQRLDAVEKLAAQSRARAEIRDCLGKLSDLERLVSRASAGLAGPRDLVALKNSLEKLPALADPLRQVGVGRLQELREELSDHTDLALLLDKAIVADPPHLLRDGGIVKPGYDAELDKLRELGKNGKAFIAALEAKEKAESGISNLKVGYNSVFGYFLEVPKSQIAKVPEHYIRKQTTANGERYITAELKEQEALVLGAEEKAINLETELFYSVRNKVAEHAKVLLQSARALAELDVFAALAEVAKRNHYSRPEFTDEDGLELHDGRHPVVEIATTRFVPNDLAIGIESGRVLIITGPNMAGKSTYLRQTALIVLMAQIGSFVPATKCRLGICDRVFARIGARDELASGQSTFMVEMTEAANILNHASDRSLVILDEVGRGTSTFDGLAIAWAMVEHLMALGSKTLFATHYHQLNALADQTDAVRNFRVAVEETGDSIVWTHRVLAGGADKSYGIHVARMAGLPGIVLTRAAELLSELEARSDAPQAAAVTKTLQFTLFDLEEPPVLKALKAVDLDQVTPMEALRLLDDWKRKFAGNP